MAGRWLRMRVQRRRVQPNFQSYGMQWLRNFRSCCRCVFRIGMQRDTFSVGHDRFQRPCNLVMVWIMFGLGQRELFLKVCSQLQCIYSFQYYQDNRLDACDWIRLFDRQPGVLTSIINHIICDLFSVSWINDIDI